MLKTLWLCLLIAATHDHSAFADSKGELRHLTANKEFISRLPKDQFEVVHPFQIREKNNRIGIDTRNHLLNATVHYKQVTIVIRTAFVGRLKLLLGLNELLFVNGTSFRKLDGGVDVTNSRRVEKCYYQGTVNGDETSFVALSTCHGLRGIIAFDNGSAYGIWPLDGEVRGRRHPHVLYQTKWFQTASCGSQSGESLKQFQKLFKRDVTKQTKYVELAVIGDHSFMKKHDLREEEGTSFMLEAINIADYMFSRELNIHLTIVYLEEWMDVSRIDYHDDIERTLSSAVKYVTGHIYHIVKDLSLLFTSTKFVSNEVTTNTFGSICSSRAAGLITAIDTYTVHDTSQLIAHNLAHILGLDHDSVDCTCDDVKSCIMHKQLGTPGSPFVWQFSKCSIAKMHNVLQSGHLQCLLNKPLQESTLQQCGNGIVDGEEECDCGTRERCFDPCCDPLTCTLRSHAQCASHQICCHRCQLRPAGYICRPARSSCDVVEVCGGDDGDCPQDGYLVDGTACGISGQCWKGNCSDIEQQCLDLWGPNASAAAVYCYERNSIGLDYANCGADRDGFFRKCAVENIHCGTLHCRGGSQTPVDHRLNSFNFQFLHESKQIQCKTVASLDVGMVMDGTSCSSGNVCVQGICLPLVQVSPPVHCPSNNLAYQCSGHGNCTTTRRCICYSGWNGPACDIKTNITHSTITPLPDSHLTDIIIPSFAGAHTLDTTTLLVILLIVGAILVLLLVCLLFCYRRRSEIEFPSSANQKLDESIPENTQRAIKFGHMPSYREEKRKRKKDKRVYDALQRITETNDEQDSLSVKSRESGNAVHVGNETVLVNRRSMEYDSRDDLVTTMLNGKFSKSAKGTATKGEMLANLRHCCDAVMYHDVPCSDMIGSPSTLHCSSVTLSTRCDQNRSGCASDFEIGMGRCSTRYVDALSSASVDLSPCSSQTSVNRITSAPLKLNNIGMLLRQLQYNDEVTSEAELSAVEADHVEHIDLGSNTESSRGYELRDANTSLVNDLDPKLTIEVKERNFDDEKAMNIYSYTSACMSNGTVLNGRSALCENCQPGAEMEIDKRSTRQGHLQSQSQHSLFTDSFRLEV